MAITSPFDGPGIQEAKKWVAPGGPPDLDSKKISEKVGREQADRKKASLIGSELNMMQFGCVGSLHRISQAPDLPNDLKTDIDYLLNDLDVRNIFAGFGVPTESDPDKEIRLVKSLKNEIVPVLRKVITYLEDPDLSSEIKKIKDNFLRPRMLEDLEWYSDWMIGQATS